MVPRGRASDRRFAERRRHGDGFEPSDQLQPLEAGVALAPDDHVVVDLDAERAGDVDDLARHRDVGVRRRRVAGRVVVDQDDDPFK